MRLDIQFRQTDPDAKAASLPSVTDKQPWIDMSELKLDDVVPPNAMTLEHNQAIFDGTMDEFPNNPQIYDWGLMTLSQSNSQGVFVVSPEIDVTFSELISSQGITLLNYPWTQDWVSSVRVTWYGDNITTAIKSGTYALTSTIGVVQEPVYNYRRVTVKLLETNIPFRFAKIFSIEYGVILPFPDEKIDTAQLLEEVDPTSDVLSINTFGFSARTHDMLFSPISGNPADNMFMKRQNMTITANNKPFGTFFLDTWKDKNNTGKIFEFRAIDAIGVMDGYRFMGDIYVDVLAGDIISQLFDLCFPTKLIKYKLDDDFANTRITGHIPIGTAREALRQICFAIGAVADTSRRNYVWIYKRDAEKTFNITQDKKYIGGSNEPTEYFSGLNVTAYSYSPTAESQEVHNGELTAGQHTFEFLEPLHTLTVAGATILTKSANYAIINVGTTGTVVLKGNSYLISERIHSIRTTPAAGQQGNICEFSGATLVDNAKAPALAKELWTYISQRIMLSSEVRLDDLEVGYIAEIETYQLPVMGTIERLDTNLRGGRSRMRAVGNVAGIEL